MMIFMKKIFAALLLVSLMFDFAYAQVERKEIDIEAYGEHVQVFNVGKEGVVFFYPLEKGFKRDKNQKYRLQAFDKELEASWSQEFSMSTKMTLLKFQQSNLNLFLLFGKTKGGDEYRVMNISLVDGEVVSKTGSSDRLLKAPVTDFDLVSTNMVLHAQEKEYPVSYLIDPYSGRIRQVGDENTYTGDFSQRVGTGINRDNSGYWDFVNELGGAAKYSLKMTEYDGAGQKLNVRDVVLGSGIMMNSVELKSIANGDQYILGSFGSYKLGKLKKSKDPFTISTNEDLGFIFGKIRGDGNMLFMNSIELKQIKSFVDMARQIPSLDEQFEELESKKKRVKSPGILNPLDEERFLTHSFKFHSVYDVDPLTKIVAVEFFHPEANYAENELPELPLIMQRREEMICMEAEDLVEAKTRGVRSSALLVMAFNNIDGSLLWDYAIKLDGVIMDDAKQRAKLVCTPGQVVLAYGADNTVVTKTLQQGAVVDNAITSVPAPNEEGGRKRKSKGVITSGLTPWYDNLFIQYEYSQVKVKKSRSKSKKKKKRKTTYSFTILPVYN
ncbi:MAG: hypothetical protein ACI8ZO_000825 [Flavobacteriales bacterium]|jgi:hypothetical protein